jgi:hypothetical protein
MVKVMEITFGDFCKSSVAAFGGKPHSSIINGLRRSARRRYDARRFHLTVTRRLSSRWLLFV